MRRRKRTEPMRWAGREKQKDKAMERKREGKKRVRG